MTASKTPRLGLMSPVGSDAFLVADFIDTMARLDANPGVPIVANAASRPTAYTSANNGQMVYQADQNILWEWNQPTSGSVGAWRRVGNVGLLGQAYNSAAVGTTVTTYANGPVVASLDVVVPGGRPLMALWSWDQLGNTYSKNMVSYWENNVRIVDKGFGGAVAPALTAGGFWLMRPAVSSTQTINFKLTIASYNATAPNGSGTTTMTGACLAIWEL